MAEAAYCAGEARYSEYEGEWKYPHSDPSRVVYQEVLLPPNAPREYADPQKLWNAVDAAGETCVAQTARKFIIAMPRELIPEQNKELIRDYCQKEFVDKGMIVDLYYHDENNGNPHVHLLISMRDGAIDCDYFLLSVLPLQHDLQKAIWDEIYREDGTVSSVMKNCVVCGNPFIPTSNRQKFCSDCKLYADRARGREKQRRYARSQKTRLESDRLDPSESP